MQHADFGVASPPLPPSPQKNKVVHVPRLKIIVCKIDRQQACRGTWWRVEVWLGALPIAVVVTDLDELSDVSG